MQTLYPASITHMVVHPQLLFDYTGKKCLNARDWEAYLDCHGGHLARLLARLPCLNVLTVSYLQKEIVYQAIVFQPCPQLVDITTYYGPPGVMFPQESKIRGPYRLYLAMEKGHLPSWNKLQIDYSADIPILTRAVRAGHLNRVKELEIWECNDRPSHLQSLLGALMAREGKLEAVILQSNAPDDLQTRRAMHELLSSPVC